MFSFLPFLHPPPPIILQVGRRLRSLHCLRHSRRSLVPLQRLDRHSHGSRDRRQVQSLHPLLHQKRRSRTRSLTRDSCRIGPTSYMKGFPLLCLDRIHWLMWNLDSFVISDVRNLYTQLRKGSSCMKSLWFCSPVARFTVDQYIHSFIHSFIHTLIHWSIHSTIHSFSIRWGRDVSELRMRYGIKNQVNCAVKIATSLIFRWSPNSNVLMDVWTLDKWKVQTPDGKLGSISAVITSYVSYRICSQQLMELCHPLFWRRLQRWWGVMEVRIDLIFYFSSILSCFTNFIQFYLVSRIFSIYFFNGIGISYWILCLLSTGGLRKSHS